MTTPTSPQALARALPPTHRHVKRGTEYVLLGFGKMQTQHWLTSARLDNSDGGYGFVERIYADNAEVAIYLSVDDGSLWVRPREEFEDGRFIALVNPTNLTALVTWALEMEARNAELEKALTDARTWHEAEDKALSKQPPSHGPNGNQWTRLQHREQIDLLTAAIAGKQS